MKHAYIENSVVKEVISVDPFTLFAPAYAAQFVEVPNEVQPGWVESGGSYSAPEIPVEQVRAELWTTIKNIRDSKVQTGGYTTGGKWYHSDTFSRTQQMALVMMGAGIPAVQWKTMDGSFVAMTQTLAGQIFAAAAAQDQAMFLQAETLRAQVYAAADPTTVDITAGWPATYS